MGLENLFIDTSDTTVTFPNCPDVATEFFQPQRTLTRKPQDERISDLVQRHIDSYEEHLSKAHGGVTIFGQENRPLLDNGQKEEGKETGRKRPVGSEASTSDKIQYHIDRYEEYKRNVNVTKCHLSCHRKLCSTNTQGW